MKRNLNVMWSLLLAFVLIEPAAARGLSDWPDRPVSRTIEEVATVVCAEDIHAISAAELEYRLGIPAGSLGGITLTALPTLAEGLLTLDGVEAPLYERLTRAEVDRLVFEPADAYISARIGFIPEYGSYRTVSLNIRSVAEPVERPTLYGAATFTLSGMARTGQIGALAQDGSQPTLFVTSGPAKGRVALAGDRYTYTPDARAKGSDSFTVVAVDSRGVYSEPCVVTIAIETYRGSRFADLAGSPYEPEATRMAALGLLGTKQVGLTHYFEPDGSLTGAEFLAAALEAAEAARGGSDNRSPWTDAQVVATAAGLGLVDSYHFDATGPIRAADAIDVVFRIAGVPVAPTQRPIDHVDALPVSAIPSYVATNAAGLLPGGAIPEADAVITRDYAAALIYNLYTHLR